MSDNPNRPELLQMTLFGGKTRSEVAQAVDALQTRIVESLSTHQFGQIFDPDEWDRSVKSMSKDDKKLVADVTKALDNYQRTAREFSSTRSVPTFERASAAFGELSEKVEGLTTRSVDVDERLPALGRMYQNIKDAAPGIDTVNAYLKAYRTQQGNRQVDEQTVQDRTVGSRNRSSDSLSSNASTRAIMPSSSNVGAPALEPQRRAGSHRPAPSNTNNQRNELSPPSKSPESRNPLKKLFRR